MYQIVVMDEMREVGSEAIGSEVIDMRTKHEE